MGGKRASQTAGRSQARTPNKFPFWILAVYQLGKGGVIPGQESRDCKAQTKRNTRWVGGTDGDWACWRVGGCKVGRLRCHNNSPKLHGFTKPQVISHSHPVRWRSSSSSDPQAFLQTMTLGPGLFILWLQGHPVGRPEEERKYGLLPTVLQWHTRICVPGKFWPEFVSWSHLDTPSNMVPGWESFPRRTAFWKKGLICVGQEPSLSQWG